MKRVLITGITGQDGSYLAELLLSKGYKVYGLVRRSSSVNMDRIMNVKDKITLIKGDMTDESSLINAIRISEPDEVYNLAAQSFVGESWGQPIYTGEVTGLGVTRLLEAVRISDINTRVYQASSSEMFGVSPPPQNERTPFHPRSPYGVAKVYAYWMAVNYRESYGMYISNGILFNHESPRRGYEFVTRKIAKAVADIYHGKMDKLVLGNIDTKRDWGHAKDYVNAMWLMLQQNIPDDYVVATGVSHSVREFCEIAFWYVGLDYRNHVIVDRNLFRPAEVYDLVGDASKIRSIGWKPSVSFVDLVKEMVDAEMRVYRG